jgi:hypothetical protein
MTHDEVLAVRRRAQELPPGPEKDRLDRLWRRHIAKVMCAAVLGRGAS